MRLRVFVKIGSRGPDGDIHDLGVAGAGLSEQAVAHVVALRYEPLPVDERVVLRVGFSVSGDREDLVQGVVEAGIRQFVPAAGNAVAAFPAMSLRSSDSAEHAEEEVGRLRFVDRRDFERGLHRDVFEELAGHEPAYAQVVFQKAVYAVYSAGFAAAEDE